ncbi:TRAP transporter small permease [Rhodobacteraceae bacterium F11138]|nr:TRAP transporter small permease [Rhodobacteraceae bacterium F11138]
MNISGRDRASAGRGLRRNLRRVTAILTGALLLALTAVTLVDVLGRYFFNSPLSGGSELTELLVMAVVFAGLPAICLDDGHITVDLFTGHLRGAAHVAQTTVARLVVAIMLALIAVEMWQHGDRLASYGETTIYLRFPLGPVAWLAAAICGASALIVLFLALTRAPRGRPEEF